MTIRKLLTNFCLPWLGGMLLWSSCTVFHTMPLEVLRTGEARLPPETGKVAWLYRHFKYTGDTLQHYYRDGETLRKGKETVTLDSLLAEHCLTAAARALQQNGVAVESVFFPFDMMPRVTGDQLTPLPPSLVQKMALPAGADLLMVLETFSWFYSRFPGESLSHDAGEVALAGIWAIYDGHSGKITETRSMVDTLYWTGDHSASGGEALKFPPRLPALEMAAATFGENYARRFYPGWMTVDRLLVIPPTEEFRQAAEYAVNQEWDKATAIWQRYSADRFGRMAVSARYNLALAAETQDQLDNALHWITRADDLARLYRNKKETTMTGQYRQILESRLQEIRKMESWEK